MNGLENAAGTYHTHVPKHIHTAHTYQNKHIISIFFPKPEGLQNNNSKGQTNSMLN
ncbi:hypothetical protein BDA96_05G102300 [Sorghum bicolor]|uniref:Uncharacterized protein n=1 Tax=Sorghum bicolor TaxID=4558 RepID=A0A921QWI3_SORBI|nr:hypothetical protein BDA96_05G102300 [Sorghum bicolor]